MSLSISTTHHNNSVKPMAISSITSPPLPKANIAVTRPTTSAAPSPPESPTYRTSHQQSYYPQQHRHSMPYYYPQPMQRTSSMSSLQQQPLSLQERRQRNKAASAKYRAKKNQQHGEMRHMILSLTKENDLLQRQLDHVRHENHKLKQTCDRLRGKMLAEKMLKKLLNGKEEEQEMIEDDTDEEEDMMMEENYSSIPYSNSKHDEHAAMLKRFDQDIDFDDDDEEE